MAPKKPLPYQKPQAKAGHSPPSSKAKTGILSREFGLAEFPSFVPLQRETQCLWQKLIAKAAKTVMSTEQSEWRHPGAVAKVSLIMSHKDLPGLEYKPPAMRKPNQDSSIENRQTIPEFGFAEFWSFCTRQWVKQELPDAKAPLSLEFCLLF